MSWLTIDVNAASHAKIADLKSKTKTLYLLFQLSDEIGNKIEGEDNL